MQADASIIGAGTTGTFSLAKVELKAGLRSGAFRFFAFIAAVLGFSVGGAPGDGAALSAYSTGEAAWIYLGFLSIGWMSLAAVRDMALRTDVMVYSKPQPTERLVFSRFLAAYGQVLGALIFMFLGAMVSRLIVNATLLGFPAYLVQFARAACVLFFACSLSFTLALLANSALVGTLTGLVWAMTFAGRSYLAKAFFPSYSQNLTFYIPLSVAVLCVALLLYRIRRRGRAPMPVVASYLLPISMALAAYGLWSNLRNGHDPLARMQPLLELMTQQQPTLGYRAPGFLYPDQYGKQTSLSDFPDSIQIIGLWSPTNPESSLMLAYFKKLREKYAAQKVQPIAICLSEDNSAAMTFAFGEAVNFPVVLDWGTHNAPRPSAISPMAEAYETDVLPKVFITDRRRKIKKVVIGPGVYEGPEIPDGIQERLAEEPE